MNQDNIEPYINLIPIVLIGFFSTLFLTPLIGYIAKKFGFIDMPRDKRKRTDKTLSQRIHSIPKLRLGGLAVLIPFILIILFTSNLNYKIIGMIVGLIILIIAGVIDDKFELKAKHQFISQFLAALIVVLSGVTITYIDFAGQRFNFNTFSTNIDLGLFQFEYIFPGFFITLFWIMLIINAINWMCGIDAIGEIMTFIASITTMLLAVRNDQLELAMISAILSANVLGYIPFNFPPSKIMSGTAGTTSYGYILAVMAVLSGSKITSAIMVLSLPVIDMIWVMIYRFINLKDIPFLKRPFVGGNTHLHHRIMGLGFSQINTLFIEVTIILLISIVSFYFGGFSSSFMILISIIILIIIVFIIITIKSRRKKKVEIPKDDSPPPLSTEQTPEQKYAY